MALISPVQPPGDGYRYAVPRELADALRPGQRVQVPFGRKDRPQVGFCMNVSDEEWGSTLKFIEAILDPVPLIDESLLPLAEWMADYYACPLGWTLAAMVPDAVRRGAGMRVVREVSLAVPAEAILNPTDSAGASPVRLSAKHRALIEYLQQVGGAVPVDEAAAAIGSTKAVLRTAEARGHVRLTTRREPRPGPDFDLPRVTPDFAINDDQQAAVKRMGEITDADAFRVVLLFGVSGSGKTEVYIRAMQRVLDAGRQVILMVPEIALTAQIVTRLAARFDDVAVMHSGLTGAQRARTWSDIALGRKRVIIGTRSAGFAPCRDLGLIVVDEEQEPSYKNLRSPRYHSRDTAIMRAHLGGFPVILGSATPSLETWYNCERLAHYECIRLPRRVRDLPLPEIELIDMRVEQRARRGVHLLSRRMEEELRATLSRGEQAVLLLNRRGYASYVFCPGCKQPIVCRNCAANLVFHKAPIGSDDPQADMCICHYCHSRTSVPTHCPDTTCGRTLIRLGMGTQRVEEELKVKIPGMRIARVDADTMTRMRDYEEVVAQFEARSIDALVGTQMIAKGLDFPFVSFVGVISADMALAIPDFRAAERTFQLIVQVAGRSGRSDRKGTAIVQSLAPQAPALQAAVVHDYERFAKAELESRRRMGLPPFTRLARILLADPRESRVRSEAAALADRLNEALASWGSSADCLGPRICPLSRIRNLYRFDLLLRAPNARELQDLLRRARAEKCLTARVKQLTIDVDPVSLL